MWVNDSSNNDSSKEIVKVYTFEGMDVPDDRTSKDPLSKIKLNTYEGDAYIYNKDYNSNVSFENRNAKTWWCVSTHFEALQQTLRDVFHLEISEANLDINKKPENTDVSKSFNELKPDDYFFKALVKTQGTRVLEVSEKYNLKVENIKNDGSHIVIYWKDAAGFGLIPIRFSDKSEYVLLNIDRDEHYQIVYATYEINDNELIEIVNNAIKNI